MGAKLSRGIALLALVILVVLFIVLMNLTSILAFQNSSGNNKDNRNLEWTIENVGGNYKITVPDITPVDLDKVSIAHLDTRKIPVEVNGSNNETLRFLQPISEFKFSSAEYDSASTKIEPAFYSVEDVDYTLFLVFIDTNDNGMIDGSDVIWIRSSENGGMAEQWDNIRVMRSDQVRDIKDLLLPW